MSPVAFLERPRAFCSLLICGEVYAARFLTKTELEFAGPALSVNDEGDYAQADNHISLPGR